MSGTKKFTFAVYVLFGTLAVVLALVGLALLFVAWPAGIAALLISAVMYLMTLSVGKSLREL